VNTDHYLIGKRFNNYKQSRAYFRDVHEFFYTDKGQFRDYSREELIKFRKQLNEKYEKYIVTPVFPLFCNNPLKQKQVSNTKK
jgi:hypothetical protein